MVSARAEDFDVAIIGGGPAGSTCSTLLKKYNPALKVLVVERERFPREHIGESQLPPITPVLEEMGVWDKVEAANFPIKIGATYRWGSSPDLWDFEFIPAKYFVSQERPSKLTAQRRMLAFQVERAIYDKILLDHAKELGVDVREETSVSDVLKTGEHVDGFVLSDGTTIRARHYIDASGNSGFMRRALGIEITSPTSLRNIAIWDYWENAEWAVNIGVGGTRVQVLSIGTGWIWFIPLSPTRTSIGFIVLADYYKQRGISPEEMYSEALAKEPNLQKLLRNARRDGTVRTTKDWSFYSNRIAGDNWYIVGEAAGFADPILAGGLTLAHTGARQCAYCILESDRDPSATKWLKTNYERSQIDRVKQYIRFADFWYAANGQFEDLRETTKKIAADAGLELNPREAFRWLSLGGFLLEDVFLPAVGGLDLLATKEITKIFCGTNEVQWEINKFTHFKLNIMGATQEKVPIYHQGRVIRADAYRRGGRILPMVMLFKSVAEALRTQQDARSLHAAFVQFSADFERQGLPGPIGQLYGTLETMLIDNWVTGRVEAGRPTLNFDPLKYLDPTIHANRDNKGLTGSAG